MVDPATFTTLWRFRAEVYQCFETRRDALFELLDAATVAGLVPSLAYLSLPAVHWRTWGSLHDALARGLLRRYGRNASAVMVGALVAVVLAFYASVVLAVGNPIHGWLFASSVHGGGHDLPLGIHVVRDGPLALSGNELLTLILAMVVLGDNRPASTDSHFGWFVPAGDLVGQAWPLPVVIPAPPLPATA